MLLEGLLMATALVLIGVLRDYRGEDWGQAEAFRWACRAD